jgi:transcriptional regulator with XRE-family HTH domain
MTQQQLARELGVTFQQLQKYEQGTNRVSGNRIAALAKALEVPVSYFFEQTADEMEAVKGSLLDTRGSISLLRAYAGIKEQSQRAALVNVARALVGEGPLEDSAVH